MGTQSDALNLSILRLLSGSHDSREKGVCLLEAVAWMAGEAHTDSPKCACPVLAAFGRRLNDRLNDEDRQLLVPLIPKLVNTRRDRAVELQRAFFFADRAVRLFAPIALRARGKDDWAKKLEELPEIIDEQTARSASKAAAYAAYTAASAASAASASAAYTAAYADAAAASDAAAYTAYAAYDAYAYAYADAYAYAADAYAYAAYADASASAPASSAEASASRRRAVLNKAIDVFNQAIAIEVSA